MAADWSREEVEAVVADYLHMLTQELAGQAFNKTTHRRALAMKLRSRSMDQLKGNIRTSARCSSS